MLLIEHDMELALGLADRVTCLHNGALVAQGTPDEIKADERVKDIYLGRGELMLEVRDLHAGYGLSQVLDGVDLEVPDGHASSPILGRNGMGKTTLCRAIMGLDPPVVTGGSIAYDGDRADRHAAAQGGARRARLRAAGPARVPDARRREEPDRRRPRRAAGPSTASGRRSRGSRSGAATTPGCCRAASSRCSRSRAR